METEMLSHPRRVACWARRHPWRRRTPLVRKLFHLSLVDFSFISVPISRPRRGLPRPGPFAALPVGQDRRQGVSAEQVRSETPLALDTQVDIVLNLPLGSSGRSSAFSAPTSPPTCPPCGRRRGGGGAAAGAQGVSRRGSRGCRQPQWRPRRRRTSTGRDRRCCFTN